MATERSSAPRTTTRHKAPKRTPDLTGSPKEFRFEIRLFATRIESLAKAYEMTRRTVHKALRSSKDKFEKYIDEKGVRRVSDKEDKSYRIKIDDLQSFARLIEERMSYELAYRDVPRIFFCSLVHQYDAYLGRLLKVAFYRRPELLNGSSRQISFADLISMGSVTDARDIIIEKEIESVIRDSHSSQFQWMENRFGLKLRENLSIWPDFIELTERRNLFVHCDGVVSSQYLSLCKRAGVKFVDAVALGKELHVSQEYFRSSLECILEIGIKLGHVLWRKLQPEQLDDADNALHKVTYELLQEERYKLAKALLLFALNTVKQQPSDVLRKMNLINLAIAYDFLGEREEAGKLLKGVDWSASEDKFKLAVAVLERRYDDAVGQMKTIGRKGSVTQKNYSSWPLFKRFRNSSKFRKAYHELFGEDFVVPRTTTRERLLANRVEK